MGPTGVGKTEVARQLSMQMGVELIRFDMSEYMERHTVSRLIGAPPGYVGFDQGGLLTDAVNQHPYAVLLLDEIEKAHPDVFNLLLQVMDDFRNVVLVMTSNVGAEQINRSSIGFAHQDHSSDGMAEVKKQFTPEFRNRLDATIQFNSLDVTSIAHIVDKFITELETQLDQKRVQLSVDSEARTWLAEKGYEGGQVPGLGVIGGEVVRMDPQSDEERIPHVGWDDVCVTQSTSLFSDIPNESDFYFIHSYHFVPVCEDRIIATTPYCGGVVSAVQKNNVFGVQFHPEKSSKSGRKLLENFLKV